MERKTKILLGKAKFVLCQLALNSRNSPRVVGGLLVVASKAFPGSSDGKESTCKAGDQDSISGWGRSPGEGDGYPLQYSCLGNPTDEEPGRLQSMGSQRVGHTSSVYCLSCVCSIAQLCTTCCSSMDCNPRGSSVHGISQARRLQGVAISFSNCLSHFIYMKNESHLGNSLVDWWLGLGSFTARPGLIPGWGMKTLQAVRYSWKEKKMEKKNEPHFEKIWKVTREKSNST